MKIAIMQPYLFPYLGYFQLINAVDTCVFYDDVNFIKGGWIHRNRILLNNNGFLFTVPLLNPSSFKLIKDTDINMKLFFKWREKFFKSVEQSYKKAPFFEETFHLVKRVLEGEQTTIAKIAMESIKEISNYLALKTQFEVSSMEYSNSIGYEKAERLIAICKKKGSNHYINPSGGKALYEKNTFKKEGITLSFIKNELIPYNQFGNPFVKGLSMIDVLMFNEKSRISDMLNEYELL
ncbi:hypothetical protein LS48_11870 [Aequorivita aquimaris]|uniref:WbqC-like protein family protein n=1 Tax=Aequorivita aquimaris TaxID=1548749 RepID=A0A137RG13_9FLAO|nr:WbqC family protein [Aequorivita aquimaris]KXN98432.1 hypothetical protein LS48_11870 [Aequorivita aquimaris]